MSNTKLRKESTLENLIADLDQRGLLVFQILLGQQAMKLLSEDKPKEVKKSTLLLPSNVITKEII